jgi:hypothetical protein
MSETKEVAGLVERLDKLAEWLDIKSMPGGSGDCREAAREIERLTAERDVARETAFEEAATLIEQGFARDVGEPYLPGGRRTKNDKCPHGRYMYEDCEQCCSAAIRSLKQGERDKP